MRNVIEAPIFAVGDEVSSLQIIPQARWQEERLGDWVFETLLPDAAGTAGFFRRLNRLILVAGENFGCGGKSNDFAVLALKDAGVELVIAESFNRIFYRLAIDLGLIVVTCPGISAFVQKEEVLRYACETNLITRASDGACIQAEPLSELALNILSEGGLLEYYKARKDVPESLFISK